MRLLEILAIYALIGAGCAIARFATRPKPGRIIDAILLLFAWPLLGPLLMSRRTEWSDPAVEEALAWAETSPLLPGQDAAAHLAERLGQSRIRQKEMERVLTTPAFSEAAAKLRHEEFVSAGDSASAEAVMGRIRQIRYIQQLAQSRRRELDRIGELLTRLKVQAEVVRLVGDDGSIQALAGELVARIDGIDRALGDGLASGDMGYGDAEYGDTEHGETEHGETHWAIDALS